MTNCYDTLNLNGVKAYFNLADVRELYIRIKGDKKGITAFMKEAQTVGEKIYGFYNFTDEEALWSIYQKYLGVYLEKKKIYSWGELMQYVS